MGVGVVEGGQAPGEGLVTGGQGLGTEGASRGEGDLFHVVAIHFLVQEVGLFQEGEDLEEVLKGGEAIDNCVFICHTMEICCIFCLLNTV